MDGSAPAELQRVAIVHCSHDRVHAGWAYDYGHLIGSFIASGGKVPETGEQFLLSMNWCMTSILPDGRQKLVEDCKRKGVKKILWLDTDMRFPRQTLHMLLRHNVPIVGANYVSRRPPYRFTAATFEEEPLVTKPGDTGLAEVLHLGFGVLLTDISVFDGDGPFFAFDWQRNKEKGHWEVVGEDVFFCRIARENGHKIYVDQELSSVIGHEGEFTFTAEEMTRVESAEVEPASAAA